MQRVEVVEVPGEFSLRGGIFDVFPTDASDPVRIEFFGDEVESIRPFDAETQRSLDRWNNVTIAVPPTFDDDHLDDFGPATDAFPEGTWIVLSEQPDLREEGKNYLARVDDPRGLYSVESTFQRLIRRPTIALSALAADSLEATCHLRIESVERFSGELNKVKAELESVAGADRVLIACHNAGEAERLREVFADSELARDGRLATTVGRMCKIVARFAEILTKLVTKLEKVAELLTKYRRVVMELRKAKKAYRAWNKSGYTREALEFKVKRAAILFPGRFAINQASPVNVPGIGGALLDTGVGLHDVSDGQKDRNYLVDGTYREDLGPYTTGVQNVFDSIVN